MRPTNRRQSIMITKRLYSDDIGDHCIVIGTVIAQYVTHGTIHDGIGDWIVIDVMLHNDDIGDWIVIDMILHNDDICVWMSGVIAQYVTHNTISVGTGDDWIADDQYCHYSIHYSQYNVL